MSSSASPPPGVRELVYAFAAFEHLTIEAAALRLGLTPAALRARCRRKAKRIGSDVLARLGGGFVAYKFGATWRVVFREP